MPRTVCGWCTRPNIVQVENSNLLSREKRAVVDTGFKNQGPVVQKVNAKCLIHG